MSREQVRTEHRTAHSHSTLDCRLASTLVAAGVAAVKSRGKSDVGAKTMLDVLVPVETALREAAEEIGFVIQGHRHQIFGLCRRCAAKASEGPR